MSFKAQTKMKPKQMEELAVLGFPKSIVLEGWMDRWISVKAVQRIAYSNQKRTVQYYAYKKDEYNLNISYNYRLLSHKERE